MVYTDKNGTYVNVPENPNVSTWPDWLIAIASVLGALKLGLAAFDIHISDELIESVLNAIGWAAVAVGIFRRQYLTKQAARKKQVLNQAGLKE